MDTPVLDMLYRYARQGGERWHMPGHKGLPPVNGDFLDWTYDVTEVGEMLETPNPVQHSEDLMARSYGSDRTWYSVAGATLPVMAGILAANPPGSTLWVDRTLHRSVLSALVIGGYQVRWLYPPLLEAGLTLPVNAFPEDFSGGSGLVMTRPTYDGLAGEIQTIIARAHDQGLKVLIDEAHGSHWQGPHYPVPALNLGADLVAHGVHKTQRTLTQTGLLHLKEGRVLPAEVDRWWRLLATSSPSYLLMASLDRLQWERRQPGYHAGWDVLAEQARNLWHTMQKKGLQLLQPWAERQGLAVDPARLTILGPGEHVKRRMQAVGGVEKVTPGSCTLILSPGQDLTKISEALDGEAFDKPPGLAPVPYPVLTSAISARDTWGRDGRWIPLDEAQGAVVKDALTPYPPGIPVAVPGEVLTSEMIEWLTRWIHTVPSPVQGLRMEEGRPWVWIVSM